MLPLVNTYSKMFAMYVARGVELPRKSRPHASESYGDSAVREARSYVRSLWEKICRLTDSILEHNTLNT